MSLLEQPLLILLSGLLVVVILVAFGLLVKKLPLMLAAGAVAVLTIGLLVLERWVVTEREQVERTLHDIAATVRTGDVEQLLRYAHSSAESVRQQARAEFHLYEIEEVRITQVWEIGIEPERAPPRAVADFNVSVRGARIGGSGFGTRRVVRFVRVTLEKEAGEWKVVSYEHDDPRRPLRRSAQP
jgi:hypothetical protein